MRHRQIFALVAVGAMVPAGAMAADAITIPTSTNISVPVADESGFDWDGFYAGVYGVVQSSPAGGVQYGAGVAAGVNATFDFFLVGGEVAFHGLTGGAGGTSYVQALAKGGLLVTDSMAVYVAGGYGLDTGVPVEDHLLVGGGIEFAVSDDISLRAQYLHGFPITGGNPVDQVSIGANVHF